MRKCHNRVGTIVFAALTATMAWGSADGATTNTAKLVTESTLIPSADAGIQLYLREKMPNVLAGVDLARGSLPDDAASAFSAR